MPKLPPGVNAKDFQDAIKQFEDAVGKPWVFTSDEDVALYKDPYSVFLGEPEEIVASAAVAPDTVEQVQKVVRIANTYKIPIYPISTGKNLGYGGAAPNLSGSVVLDLKRMNRILEVNDRNHYALVEPGVSYFDLYRYVHDRGLKVLLDLPDPGWGSPVGNSLDHGVGYSTGEMRDHFGSHCGMEVVLANGELMRTGMGAVPNAKTWQEYRYGAGPYVDGLFSQSNFGVVTKMGFWLNPLPDAYRMGTVTVPKQQDLIPLVDILNYLENSGISNGMPSVGSPIFGGPFQPPDPEVMALVSKPGGATPAELEQFGERKGRGYWSCSLQFYGPEKVIAAQWDYAKEKFSSIAGAKFSEGPSYKFPLTPQQLATAHQVAVGVPNLSIFSIGARSPFNANPSHGHAWFSPVIPRTGEALLEAQKVFADLSRESGLPLGSPVILPTGFYKRAFLLLFGIMISTDPAVNKKNREAFRKMIKLAADRGYAEYRTPPAFQDDVVGTYSFNNHALLRFHETLKDAVDPNGILAAGRYGIWPKNMRPRKA
jgi:FAD/FMN-containing dehydrogenase